MSFNDTEMTRYFVAIMHERTVIKTTQYYNFKMETKEQSVGERETLYLRTCHVLPGFLNLSKQSWSKTSVKERGRNRMERKKN